MQKAFSRALTALKGKGRLGRKMPDHGNGKGAKFVQKIRPYFDNKYIEGLLLTVSIAFDCIC